MPRGSSALTYIPVSTHTTLEDATLALHAYDAYEYVTAYNYGAYGSGRVFRCISHKACARRLRILETSKDEEEIPITFQLAVVGEHGTQETNRKRVGIDLSVKGEADALLAAGVTPKDCRLTLQKKYMDQPEMLAKVPDESQLKNRLITLRKHGWRSAEAGTAAGSWTMTTQPHRQVSRKRRERVESSGESSEGSEEEASSTGDDGDSREIANFEEREQFDREKLMKEFTALPGRPVLWSILRKTRYIKDKSEDVVTQWMTGQVIGWQTRDDSPTKWVVRFTDGEKRCFQLEELIEEIRSAAQLGLNVTGRPLDF